MNSSTSNLNAAAGSTADNYGIVLMTTASAAEAEALATALLELRLVACANYFPIQSLYTWQGAIEHAQEYQLLLKTNLAVFEQLSAQIQRLHAYDTPEIIALPITHGSPAYLAWLGASIQGQA